MLGRYSQMGRGEAEAALSAILQPINSGLARGPRPLYTLEQFIENVYLPFCRRSWKESTAGTSEQIVNTHLIPEFGKHLLPAIQREELQDFLDRKALELSSSPVKHLRWFLNAIFKLGLSDGLVVNNPAAALRIPRTCQPGRTMRPLTEEEVLEFLEVFDLREELISRLAIYEGMRPGEILALRWKAVRHCALWVEQRVYKRVFDTPKNGKSREVGLSDGTSALLKEWRDLAEDAGPEGFVFPSEALTTPISADNLWRRNHAAKAGDRLGLGIVPGSTKDKCKPIQEIRRRSEGSLRSAGAWHRRQYERVHQFGYRTETSCGEQTRGRRASTKARGRTPVT